MDISKLSSVVVKHETEKRVQPARTADNVRTPLTTPRVLTARTADSLRKPLTSSRVADPASTVRRLNKLKDSKSLRDKSSYRLIKRKVSDAFDEFDLPVEAVPEITGLMEEERSEDVLYAVIDVLSSVIADLQAKIDEKTVEQPQVTDRKRTLPLNILKRRLRDDLNETETTQEAVDVVTEYLQEADPEDVIEATVDVLSGVIEGLTEQNQQ